MDREKVIKRLKEIPDYLLSICHHLKDEEEIKEAKDICNTVEDALDLLKKQEKEIENLRQTAQSMMEGICLLKEQEVRELTMDEWREWKNNPKRDPICKLWEYDTSPMWILNPNDVHEPALLMGKLKLFTGKPTFEQCKAVKWDGRKQNNRLPKTWASVYL